MYNGETMYNAGLEGYAYNVWKSPTYGTVCWEGHLLTDKPKLHGKYRSCYTLKMYEGFLSPVQVQQVPSATPGRKCEWEVFLYGESRGLYDYKRDAQRAAKELVGV